MAKLVEYTVAREHQGDKLTDDGSVVHRFLEGETRLANPSVVAPLVKSGVLVAPEAEPKKSDEPHEDKSEGDSEENKAEPKKPARTKAK